MDNDCRQASYAESSKWTVICDLLDTSREKFADRILFRDPSGKTISYAEAGELVDDLARGYILDGFAAGDRICLLGERNCSAWCISYLAILRIGSVVVPLDPSLTSDELTSMLAHCEVSGVVTSGKAIEVFEEIRNNFEFPRKIVALDNTISSGVTSTEDLMRRGREQNIKFPRVDPDSLAVLIYTSGTTGRPKGVMLSHNNIVSDIETVHRRLHFSVDDIFLSILPLHHTFECTCGFLTPMSKGCRIVFARSFKSGELLEDIRDNHVTIMCGVPLLYEKMYLSFKRKLVASPALKRALFRILFSVSSYGTRRHRRWGRLLLRSIRKKAGIDSIRMLVSGGAALPCDVGHFFNTIGVDLVQGYGLSETSPVLSVNPIKLNKIDSIGPPLDGVEVRIDNPDSEGMGEIVVRGPMVMLGYFKDDDATADVLRQGWFFTGDIGCIDSDGYLYITGRSKSVIVSAAGKNIYPEEIETMLNASPHILESLVLGKRVRNSNVEEVTAVIVPDLDSPAQAPVTGGHEESHSVEDIIRAEVTAICSRLADFKRIKKFYIRYEEIPKTSTRKVKRCLEIDDSGNLREKKRV